MGECSSGVGARGGGALSGSFGGSQQQHTHINRQLSSSSALVSATSSDIRPQWVRVEGLLSALSSSCCYRYCCTFSLRDREGQGACYNGAISKRQ
eukprot:8506-Heterococcus_DN1.PRE.1